MRTRDRIALLALGLALGATPAAAFEGTAQPPVIMETPPVPVAPPPVGMAPASVNSRATDAPRPPGLIPHGGAASAIGLPSASLPRPRAPVPAIAAPSAPGDRPLPPPTAFAAPSIPITPFEAFKSGARALRDGQTKKGLAELQYAAERGEIGAQWKLGRMFAEGDGVEQSDLRAFRYFSQIADGHAEDNPTGQQAPFVANAFVSLGTYYRDGIADSDVKPDYFRARWMYSYAASYFRDPDAQYYLARLLLDDSGPNNDPRQGTRWLYSAANKGQTQAQAVLGRMLFQGEHLQRQPARGLMWLALANANASPSDSWIRELYAAAFKQASDEERAIAGDMLVRWMNGRRD
jgi:exopolysaccharide production negative regulator